MVAHHDITWLAPDSLWTRERLTAESRQNGAFNRPAILRFRSDEFMDELLSTVAFKPEALSDWLALPETWREPQLDAQVAAALKTQEPRSQLALRINGLANTVTEPQAVQQPVDPVDRSNLPFKLYQPAQQRFYVVAASLVCRLPGLPDRAIDAGKQEQVSFVIRRVVGDDEAAPDNPDARDEYGYVASDRDFVWQQVAHDARYDLVEEEERLPLFAVNYTAGDKRRRLLGALVPVGKREAYAAAGRTQEPGAVSEPAPVGAPTSALGALFVSDVVAPWRALVEHAAVVEQSLVPSPPAVVPGSEKVTQAAMADGVLAATLVTMQIASWLILLDFAKFLARYGPSVWQAINTGGSLPAATPERALLDMLNSIEVPTNLVARLGSGIVHASYSVTTTLPQALVQARAAEQKLEAAENDLDLGAAPDEYPTFLFPLAHPGVQVDAGAAQVTEIDPLLRGAYMTPHAGSDAPEDILDRIDALLELVEALPEDPAVVVPDIRPVDQPWDQKDPWFVIRCVYERPNCGPFEKPVLSLSSQPFQMASFFDPDAPQRNVRIPMPLDISPAGLRKFQKNASFIVSDLFCGKVSKIRKMTFADLVLSVLPWPFHKDLPSVGPAGPCKDNGDGFGLIFSLSIPIVTLCAMILLIIMVALFDLFFKWIPFLFMAIPIPGLKAKKQVGGGELNVLVINLWQTWSDAYGGLCYG